MSGSPKVSVLLPTHNGLPWLSEAVASVLGQTFTEFELLIIDDGSTDDTPKYVEALPDPRIRYHRLEKRGLVGALNYGIEQARGELIARLDADDIYEPAILERQAGYFAAHPDCVLLSCNFRYINGEGLVIGELHKLTSDAALRWRMVFTTPFTHPGSMYRRSAAVAAGGYNASFPVAQDYEFWTRLAFQGRMTNLTEFLFRKRVLSSAIGSSQPSQQREAASRVAGLYGARVCPGIDPSQFQALYRFLWFGELPVAHGMERVLQAYQQASRVLGATHGDDPELRGSMCDIQERLRWRCVGLAEHAWRRPSQVWRWLKMARAFDPEQGGYLQVLSRGLRGLVTNRRDRSKVSPFPNSGNSIFFAEPRSPGEPAGSIPRAPSLAPVGRLSHP